MMRCSKVSLCDLRLDLAPHRVLRYSTIGSRGTLEDCELCLFRNGLERVLVAVNRQD